MIVECSNHSCTDHSLRVNFPIVSASECGGGAAVQCDRQLSGTGRVSGAQLRRSPLPSHSLCPSLTTHSRSHTAQVRMVGGGKPSLKLRDMEEKHLHNLFLKNMSGLIEEVKNPTPRLNP